MKNIIAIILLLIITCSTSLAQRRRATATFDADTTRPTPGTHGITVIRNQPYLVPHAGRAQRIEVSPLFIEARSFGSTTTTATLPTTVDHIIIARDSTHIVLPNKTTAGEGKRYYITFMGLRGFTADTVLRWMPYDSTFSLTFSDTIFCRVGDPITGLTHFTMNMTNEYLNDNFTKQNFFRIWQNSAIYLELIENRWYRFFADIKF